MKFKSYEYLENEADRTIELRGVPENGSESSIHIAYFAMGSGLALDEGGIIQADDSDADGFDAAVSGAIDVAQKKGYAIPADICRDLVRLAHINEEAERLSAQIGKELDRYFDIGIQDQETNLREITSSSMIAGCTEKTCEGGRRYLAAEDGKPLARENGGAGFYIDQHTGYCEDDYYGEMYIKMWGRDEYLHLHYDC